MEEEQKNLEQPITQELSQSKADSEINLGELDEVLEGSLPNKFKTIESLVEAYNNLQAEFTRKSQKLSEVGKELTSLKENTTKKEVPFYEDENYEKMVETFFHENPSAKEYASEISNLLLEDNALTYEKQPLNKAWAKILTNKFTNLDETLNKDSNLLKRVIENKTVQDSIIQNYLASLKEQKTTPVISTHNGTALSLTPKSKPTSLEEAKILAEALFKI